MSRLQIIKSNKDSLFVLKMERAYLTAQLQTGKIRCRELISIPMCLSPECGIFKARKAISTINQSISDINSDNEILRIQMNDCERVAPAV